MGFASVAWVGAVGVCGVGADGVVVGVCGVVWVWTLIGVPGTGVVVVCVGVAVGVTVEGV